MELITTAVGIFLLLVVIGLIVTYWQVILGVIVLLLLAFVVLLVRDNFESIVSFLGYSLAILAGSALVCWGFMRLQRHWKELKRTRRTQQWRRKNESELWSGITEHSATRLRSAGQPLKRATDKSHIELAAKIDEVLEKLETADATSGTISLIQDTEELIVQAKALRPSRSRTVPLPGSRPATRAAAPTATVSTSAASTAPSAPAAPAKPATPPASASCPVEPTPEVSPAEKPLVQVVKGGRVDLSALGSRGAFRAPRLDELRAMQTGPLPEEDIQSLQP